MAQLCRSGVKSPGQSRGGWEVQPGVPVHPGRWPVSSDRRSSCVGSRREAYGHVASGGGNGGRIVPEQRGEARRRRVGLPRRSPTPDHAAGAVCRLLVSGNGGCVAPGGPGVPGGSAEECRSLLDRAASCHPALLNCGNAAQPGWCQGLVGGFCSRHLHDSHVHEGPAATDSRILVLSSPPRRGAADLIGARERAPQRADRQRAPTARRLRRAPPSFVGTDVCLMMNNTGQ